MDNNEYRPLQAFVAHPIPEMPPEMSDAFFGKGAPEIRREIPDANAPFGFFAKVIPIPADPEIEEEPFEYEHPLTKLLAPDLPVATGTKSVVGPGYSTAEPTRFLNDEIDSDDMEADRALEEIRKMRREGVYYVAPTEAPNLRMGDPEPAPQETAAEQILTKSVANAAATMRRANLTAFVKRRVAEGESVEELADFAANDPATANLIREIGRTL